MKLFPQLAMSFAHTISNSYVVEVYEKMTEQIDKNDFGLLEIMHHFSSGFKSVQTQDTCDGAEIIRASLGGAGYSAWSGLPRIMDEYSPTVTFEGDNTVMAQQSFNFLAKQAKSAFKGKLEKIADSPAFDYLKDIGKVFKRQTSVSRIEDLMNIDTVKEILE